MDYEILINITRHRVWSLLCLLASTFNVCVQRPHEPLWVKNAGHNDIESSFFGLYISRLRRFFVDLGDAELGQVQNWIPVITNMIQ